MEILNKRQMDFIKGLSEGNKTYERYKNELCEILAGKDPVNSFIPEPAKSKMLKVLKDLEDKKEVKKSIQDQSRKEKDKK